MGCFVGLRDVVKDELAYIQSIGGLLGVAYITQGLWMGIRGMQLSKLEVLDLDECNLDLNTELSDMGKTGYGLAGFLIAYSVLLLVVNLFPVLTQRYDCCACCGDGGGDNRLIALNVAIVAIGSVALLIPLNTMIGVSFASYEKYRASDCREEAAVRSYGYRKYLNEVWGLCFEMLFVSIVTFIVALMVLQLKIAQFRARRRAFKLAQRAPPDDDEQLTVTVWAGEDVARLKTAEKEEVVGYTDAGNTTAAVEGNDSGEPERQ